MSETSNKWEEREEARERRAEENERRAELAVGAQVDMHRAIARTASLDAEAKHIALANATEEVQERRRASARNEESHEAYLADLKKNSEDRRRQTEAWDRIATALEKLTAPK